MKIAEPILTERRQKIWTCLTRGMKGYEIAKELGVGQSTVSRDIKHLTVQSHDFLNDLAKETMPFMYQISISGIDAILKECWNIFQSPDKSINSFQRLAALKLAKECNEARFKLLDSGPSVLAMRKLQEELNLINENRQIH